MPKKPPSDRTPAKGVSTYITPRSIGAYYAKRTQSAPTVTLPHPKKCETNPIYPRRPPHLRETNPIYPTATIITTPKMRNEPNLPPQRTCGRPIMRNEPNSTPANCQQPKAVLTKRTQSTNPKYAIDNIRYVAYVTPLHIGPRCDILVGCGVELANGSSSFQ